MSTETAAVDEAAIEAEIEGTTAAGKKDVQHKLDNIARRTNDLKTAVTIKHRYLAEHPGDSISVKYGCTFTDVEVTAGLDNFDSLSALLRMFREAGYHRRDKEALPWGAVRYDYHLPGCWRSTIELTVGVTGNADAACRLVQVSEETITRPVYEIQCGGKPVVDTPEPEPAIP